ncbi:MAG: nucleotidyl transferase AbiEii/AbiGii toxin family protein [Thermoguttaceae bacterium]|nr:nucleotidyl transferase AbiEii/AbiGii toxin family protein [Thermoguttaceae bacterium]
MIGTSTQLKAKIRNLSGGDSAKALTLIRNFVMERFLERIALSKYRNNIVLKGGMLVAAIVGLDTRATMDIDTTVRSLSLSKENAIGIVDDIIAVEIPDGIRFKITRVTDIMEEHDYPGVRFMLEAALDKMRQTIKIDISTGDTITPGAVEYSYKLMFEDRAISLWTYNLETLLAEKLETIMARGTANSRMRDFYDIHVISRQEPLNTAVLKNAFFVTSKKRSTAPLIPEFRNALPVIESDGMMRKLWENYRENSFFVGELSWGEVMKSVKMLAETIL